MNTKLQAMRSARHAPWPLAIVLAAAAAGCAEHATVAEDADFGVSVHNMVQQQLYNPEAALHAPTEPPAGLDGQYAAAAMKAYRARSGKTDSSATWPAVNGDPAATGGSVAP